MDTASAHTAPQVNPGPKRKRGIRILAAVLAVLLLISAITANGIRIRVKPGDPDSAQGTAATALMQESDFARVGAIRRAQLYYASMLNRANTLEAYQQRASVLIGQAKYKDALDVIDACLAFYDGGNTETLDELHMQRGCLQAMLGDYAAMRKSFAQVSAGSDYQRDILLMLAQLAIEENDAAAAIQTLEQYLGLWPEESGLRDLLAQLYYLSARYDDAIAATTRCMDADGDAGGARSVLLGRCYVQTGGYEQALSAYLQAIENGYADPGMCYSQCALVSYALQRFEETLSYGEKALELGSPELSAPDLQYYMGLSSLMREDYEAGSTYLSAAAEGGAAAADLWYYCGICHLMREAYEDAAGAFGKSIEAEFNLDSSYYNRAICYVQMGDRQGALADLQAIISRNADEDLCNAARELAGLLGA